MQSFYKTSKTPSLAMANPQYANFIEIKPIEAYNHRKNSHVRNSGLYDPEIFNEGYKHLPWQFKNRVHNNVSPHLQ